MQNRSERISGCSGKRQYANNAAAVQAAISLHNRASKGKPSAYYCAVCGGFHIGRNPSATKPRIIEDDNMLLDKFRNNAKTASETVEKTFGENRELSWFAQRVGRGNSGAFSEVATITPSIARHILDYNPDNRRVYEAKVQEIAGDIKGGRWKVNGETIIVAKDGSLNDGQHRLWAVIEAGQPISTMIVFGVDRDTRYTVDMGMPRTTGDFLGMRGVKNYNHVASISRLYDTFNRGVYARKIPGQTKTYLLDVYRKNAKDMDEAASRAGVACTSKDGVSRYAGVPAWGVAFMLCNRANPAMAETFFARLSDGVGLKRTSPILALRARLMVISDQRLGAHERCGLILAHWNAWRKDVPVTRSLPVPKSWPNVEG
jgi:hypothetical protein